VMFSVAQKRQIAAAVQQILRETNHPELPTTEIQFTLQVRGAEEWSYAVICNNVKNPAVSGMSSKRHLIDPSQEESSCPLTASRMQLYTLSARTISRCEATEPLFHSHARRIRLQRAAPSHVAHVGSED
jgi:hypothetical protein